MLEGLEKSFCLSSVLLCECVARARRPASERNGGVQALTKWFQQQETGHSHAASGVRLKKLVVPCPIYERLFPNGANAG